MKANPDSPQLPVRRRALADGERIYIAVPTLRGERPFVRLRGDATINGRDRGGHGAPEAARMTFTPQGAERVAPAAGRRGPRLPMRLS